MKLIMTLLVKDEKDIIEENLKYHLSAGIDHFIATDNDSKDGTTEVLKQYSKMGVLDYKKELGSYSQSKWVTEMARYAYKRYKADWIINNDADEFWYHSTGNLKNAFQKIPRKYCVAEATRHNMLLDLNTHLNIFYKNMIYRRKKSLNLVGNHLPSKVCSRGNMNLVVMPGSHTILYPHKDGVYKSDIEIFHYPVRSYKQFIRKVCNIGSGYESNPQICNETGRQPGGAIRFLYESYKKNPSSLEYFFKTIFATPSDTKNSDPENAVIQDTRLLQILSSLIEN